jgi:hypothetical protein
MAGDLYYLDKGGQRAICEQAQIAPMEAKGWTLAGLVPPPDVPAGASIPQPRYVKEGMFQVYKGGKAAWADGATRAAILAAGWSLTPPEDVGEAGGDPPTRLTDEALRDMLEGMDATDDDLWNQSGTLSVRAFNDAFGTAIKAADVDRVWPDFTRDALEAYQE